MSAETEVLAAAAAVVDAQLDRELNDVLQGLTLAVQRLAYLIEGDNQEADPT